MNKQLVPSLLAFDKKQPYEQLKIFQKHHLQTIHYDVMDLAYVNNTAFETEHLEWLLKNNFLVHIHLMVINPLQKIKQYFKYKPTHISFHFEMNDYQTNLLIIDEIKKHSIFAGIAIHPHSSLNDYAFYLKEVDYITFMSVVPGKGGQLFLEESLLKLQELYDYKIKNNLTFKIEIDGGITLEIIKKINIPIDFFISGSYLVRNIEKLDQIINAFNQLVN
ncbi:ribulose-phosphate 3-epimerase [Ureaplasma urealyticum]|uniref:ribulose-phosphate 3-epimerase n=1 Tax=Ureaplasma urealyticum TaxID=2130 RepID=UPI0001721F96|nr:ribulose-phosphate 3-epimerase [Ureaplasma urealyticum]EDT49488.1 D-ribulose-5-phosphate 3 epimerase [Ureaplasma urealyticum serovar 13 str. ATCC 33698]EEH02360.1 D-ribulose-5-phosphate 3 epimerase [Ureaplasma urealyticum serovar 2 str. ATCC 27814]MDU3864851.1 ribulose-phosphate 3-epimerase [Ureaplasma urealyticum]